MARSGAGTALCAALAVSFSAADALAKPRASRPSAPAATAKPAPPTQADTPAPRRAQMPALALRPEFSEGEWSDMGGQDQLDPASLAGSTAPVDHDGGRLETVRVGSALAKITERQLQVAPMPTRRLDQPTAGVAADMVTTPLGFDLRGSGFTISRADAAE